ncbi:MAG: PDZ domain-containing protein, partial [Tepidisphaeraceae bacterium]
MKQLWIACIATTIITSIAAAQTTRPATQPGGKWADYRTVDTAVKAEIRAVPARDEGVVPYLGVEVTRTPAGKLRVEAVDPASPAGKADIRAGDLLLRVAGKAVDRPDALMDAVQSRLPGEKLQLGLERQSRETQVSAVLDAASRPLKINAVRAVLGVQLADTPDKDGVLVDKVTANMPAAEAGMHPGDVVVDVDGRAVTARQELTDLLATRAPDQTVSLHVRREGKLEQFKVKLVADNNQPRGRQGGREATYWKQPVYRLAVIGIEYPDAKHNPKITLADWDASLFSKHTYTTTSATGQKVYGSVNDYYLELSCGAFHLEGKVFNWVEVGKKRTEFGQGTGGDGILLTEVLDNFLAREGKD